MTSSQRTSPAVILGFDPGRQKCGLAVVTTDKFVLSHQIVNAEEAIATLQTLYQQFPVITLVMGDQTTAQEWKQKIQTGVEEVGDIVLVDERYTSLEARDRYWEMYPPRGLTQIIPKGMRTPPRPIDDIVAILLVERYLDRVSP
ncbi:MAG: pre-16S rRNA-processing nuclease YqgF [Synechococcales cyanobacterium T60_A2020_003]|nr:pre-16S rRNA-processing nuclease YqgF [Synechococcales cyanobacterium T60_A2020_003]